mgnify:CR=1 FL=1
MSEDRLIVEERDEFGVIRVVEQGDFRYLEFGDEVEQSCVLTADPSWLWSSPNCPANWRTRSPFPPCNRFSSRSMMSTPLLSTRGFIIP